jgi:Predicted membrane protein (DUF2254).
MVNVLRKENFSLSSIDKLYLLMMAVLFIFVAYNRSTDFIVCEVLLLAVYMILSIKLDKWQVTYPLFLFLAIILGIFSFELIGFLFPDATFLLTNTDSARYLVSALIQSEAAIIAIVVTLSLVAVQQTSSSYSTRVIDLFKDPRRNPNFFILIFAYVLCIMSNSFLLKIIKSQSFDKPIVTTSIEIGIWISCILFIFLLFALIPYISRTLEMFKPSTLIRLLSENISKESIESAIVLENSNNMDRSGQIKPINDTIQPIVDVLQGSIKSYDYETTRYGLRIIESKTIQILGDKSYDHTYKEAITNRIIDYLKIIGILATKQEMERTVNDTVKTFLIIYNCLIETEIHQPIDALISVLLNIGEQTINAKLDNSTISILKTLNEIGIKSIEKNHNEISQKVIGSIVKIALENISVENSPTAQQILYSNVCNYAIQSIGKIGEKIAEKEWDLELIMLEQGLDQIGESLIEYTVNKEKLKFLLHILLHTVYSISQKLLVNDIKYLILDVASEIHSIGIKAFKKNSEVTRYSIDLLNRLIGDIIRHDLQDTSKLNDYGLYGHIHKLRDELHTLVDGTSEQS